MRSTFSIDTYNLQSFREHAFTVRTSSVSGDASLRVVIQDRGTPMQVDCIDSYNQTLIPKVSHTVVSGGENNQVKCLINTNHKESSMQDYNYRTIVRRLTPVEGMRLQGFTPGQLDAIKGDSGKFKTIGNSWAVPCARQVIKGIHKARAWKLKESDKPLKYGTISSGVEAHSMASEGLGDTAVFFSEIDPIPCKVLADKYPQVQNLGDMTLVDYDADKEVIHNRPYDGYTKPDKDALGFDAYATKEVVEIPCGYGDIDIISGGTPCQSISIAGKRAGMAEDAATRSALAFQLPRIGKAVGSDFILWENVCGAFSSNKGKDFLWFLHRCNEAGYTVAWRTFDAKYVRSDKHPRGVPQTRRRIFMVGYKGDDWRVPVKALFEPMKVLGNTPPTRTVGKGFLTINPDYTPEVCQTNQECCDLFGSLFGESAQKHQGADITNRDLELDFPKEENIREVSLFALNRFVKSISKEVGYIGELLQDWKWDSDGDGRKKVPAENDVDSIPEALLGKIGNAGILSNGFIMTMKTPEWNAGVTKEELAEMPDELASLYDGDVCGLTDILLSDEDVDKHFLLTWKACYGIDYRCKKKGKTLPVELHDALVSRIIELSLIIKHDALEAKNEEIRNHAKMCLETHVMKFVGMNNVDDLLTMADEDIEKLVSSNESYTGDMPMPRFASKASAASEEDNEDDASIDIGDNEEGDENGDGE